MKIIFKDKFKPLNFLTLWLPVTLWCLIIFLFSSLQTNAVGAPFNLGDFIFKKTAHITEFAILTILLFRAIWGTFPNSNLNKVKWTTFILSLLYAISDEYHQSFVYGRTSTLRDVIIDTIGIALALYLIKVIKNNKKYKKIKKFIFE